jgi:hypothetical protein
VGKHNNTYSVSLFDKDGNDVSDLYWLRREYGDAVIEPLAITVKAGDAQKIYDGTPLKCDEYELIQGQLLEGHYVNVCLVKGEQTDVGRSDNMISQIVIFDENGKEVTQNYLIELLTGKLKVTYR